MGKLYLIRGVSGSGKTTLAETLAVCLPKATCLAADDYFYKNGEYKWERDRLRAAHAWCLGTTLELMTNPAYVTQNVIVHNTFTTDKQLRPYLEIAECAGWEVTVLTVENRHGNKSVHGVPDETLERQRRQLRDSMKL